MRMRQILTGLFLVLTALATGATSRPEQGLMATAQLNSVVLDPTNTVAVRTFSVELTAAALLPDAGTTSGTVNLTTSSCQQAEKCVGGVNDAPFEMRVSVEPDFSVTHSSGEQFIESVFQDCTTAQPCRREYEVQFVYLGDGGPVRIEPSVTATANNAYIDNSPSDDAQLSIVTP